MSIVLTLKCPGVKLHDQRFMVYKLYPYFYTIQYKRAGLGPSCHFFIEVPVPIQKSKGRPFNLQGGGYGFFFVIQH